MIQAEALGWLAENSAPERTSVFTSLPDLSEVPPLDLPGWRAWFIDAARGIVRWVPPSGVAIFYQSDIRHQGAWIDKGYLVMRAAEEEGARVLWHKIVCRKPPGSIALGRPSYSHMIALTMGTDDRQAAILRPGPDVLPSAGFMPWSRATGAEACRVGCRFLREETDTKVVVDPFCGRGTIVAIAHAMGFDTIGIDLSAKRCRAARRLVLSAEGDSHDASVSLERALAAGAARFDDGAYWEAHEVWEARWRTEERADEKRVLQGLIQVAAAFHQWRVMQSTEAAKSLFSKAVDKLSATSRHLDADALRRVVVECAAAIEDGRGDGMAAPSIGALLTPNSTSGAEPPYSAGG